MIIPRSTVIEALEVAGLDEDAMREDYSGRAMFGDECLGVVFDTPGEILLFAAHLGATADDWDFLGRARGDQMGLSTIYYWPGVKVGDDE